MTTAERCFKKATHLDTFVLDSKYECMSELWHDKPAWLTADGGLESPDTGEGELEVTAQGITCFFSELTVHAA